jgi:sterol desaturase/sphingolipid hydroxylase (fatty acid hydroxylase superfamily)
MNDATLRLIVTISLLALFVLLENRLPARKPALNAARFLRHIGLSLVSATLARLALVGGLASIATMCSLHGVGIFNFIQLPVWLTIILSFLLLDAAIWAQHIAMHKVPFLWRLHRVHHSDIAMDVSTALRFHPFEILVSLGFKALVVVALGAPALAVFYFEMALGAAALMTHANVAFSPRVERLVRIVFITPTLHLSHHSPDPLETNSNYGFCLSIWDRIFGTLRLHRIGTEHRIGLEDWRSAYDQTLPALLANPFKNKGS